MWRGKHLHVIRRRWCLRPKTVIRERLVALFPMTCRRRRRCRNPHAYVRLKFMPLDFPAARNDLIKYQSGNLRSCD
ncbi:hypothetical protein KC19_VG197500 [Ceratodon purpureus]|uniref:Uncharacterized protein n=1 Tax=Ceratodon purpureus TaxID=3225 RepID=A0A8T0HSD5_CERPU|nr:hypothetical protein KC19_VG197500 [Ceratodon purpureus]